MVDRTMEELLQAPMERYGEAIVILKILAENFEIKTNLLQDVPNDAIKLMLFPYSLEDRARIWYEKEPPNSILTWDDLVNKFVNQFFPPSKTTHLKNEISRFTQRFEETFSEAWDRFKELLRACPHHGISELTQIDTFYNGLTEQDQDSLNAASGVIAPAKAVEKTCVTCGGAHAYYECIATDSNPSSVCAETGSYNQVSPPIRASHQIPPPGFAPVKNNPNRFNQGQGNYFNQENNFNQGNNFSGNNFQNNQGYRTQINNALNFQNQGFQNQPFSVPNNQIPPSVPNEFSSYMKSNEIMIKSIQNQINVLRDQPSTLGTLPSNTVPSPKGEMKAVTTRSGLAYEGPLIPTESPLEKVDEQNTEEILDKEHSNSTAQVQPLVVPILIPEPDVPRTQTKPIISYPSRLNDQKLREKATNQMEKFFQIFHDLQFDISFANALLLMPKFASTIKSLLANKDKIFELANVSLNESCSAMLLKKLPEKVGDPELTPTRMTLELADRSITRPKGVAEDVFVKVGKFHFPTDFVVVDFEADPRVPLILGRSFLRTGRALIDLYGEEITLRVNDESITFNLNQTMRYSSTYDDTSVNKVDVIDIACEDFVQDVLDFQYNPKSSNPTLVSDDLISKSDSCKEPIIKSSSLTLTPFRESDFFLEEIEDFLNDDSIPTGIENSVYDPEGDILFLEKLLNEDPFQLPPMDLKLAEESKEKSFVEVPPELELKELPSHLEHAFLEDSNKLPGIIAKNLKVDEREALINVLKSHKWAISWKISDIKGIDPSPWVSLIHYVPKKGGMTVVANENNELILTRLVTGWGVCIDYRKLNDATRKDHFPLPFMDQMLEWLAGNEFYCFLDGFSGYFQIPIDPQDQEKTTFTCPYGTFAYRRMPFGLCNAPGAFQRCMISIFHDMIEKIMEVFMDDFSVFGDSFSSCLTNLDKMLNRCEETNLVLNWEQCHLMYREGIVLGHKISKSGIEVDRAKVDDFSKIARPMTHLLEKETPFVFSKECINAFNTLKKKLTEAPILVVPDWNLPFELMCDASDYAIGAVLGQCKSKHFQPIYYASKTMTEAQIHYTTTEKEMLAIVYAFEKFRPYLVLSKSIVYTDHSALKYLLNKQDAKPRKLLKFSKLAMRDPPGDIMVSISQRRRGREEYLREMRCLKTISNHDYLSKWVKAKALSTNDARVVVKLLKSLFSRFGIPRAIISDRGTHFCNDQFTRVMIKYEVTHRLATAYHPQTSGQVEISNHGLKRILERTVGENHTLWYDKLNDALWAFRTAYKTPIGCTPYKLVYGKSCHLPIELEHRAYWALKHSELHDQAYENYVIYKERTKKFHDSKIKNHIFNVGDQVLLFNSRLKIFSGKLKTRWSGPFTITRVFPYGTIELSQPNGPNFKVNGHRLKHYFGGDIPSNVASDLHTFPMDN
uniref:Reverse transcriptase domain-containing protein n=1 Tax=Tanacetum cinerariifolium TaxID=118510 RepID=A0A6L2N311_TANCI|nr:reverse transcriptase domain-containing protein [Tanacetum cinerariifolium]